MSQRSQGLAWVVSVLSVLVASGAGAEVATDFVANKADSSNSSVSSVPPSVAKIPRVRDRDRPATTVKQWVAQMEAATVQVTGVKLNRTNTGLDIVLETAEGKPLQVDATKFRTEGNNLIAEIPNAVLALPQGQTFVAENPTVDIVTVQVIQQEGSAIRISVAGTNALPKTEVTLKTGGLAYSLNPEADEPDEEIVVTGDRSGYRVPNSSIGTRTDTPLRDIPQSIQVVPRQVIEDQQAVRLEDAVRNVSGATSATTSAGSIRSEFNIRGFRVSEFSGNFFRNGLRDNFASSGLDLSNVERVEVLLGPASVLFGGATPGRTINIITKQPLRNPYYSAELSIGNYDFYRSALDQHSGQFQAAMMP